MKKNGMRKGGGGFLGLIAIACLWFTYQNLAQAEVPLTAFEWKITE